ncbi:MAG: hypothetical protein JW959_03875 [Pirellulales bacterium]|nr:hypothetical protein [Pirellulales bacterium]
MVEKRTARDVNGLIAEYEWLRRMMVHLEMQTEGIDRQLVELEKCLPDDYNFPGDPEMKQS